MLIIVGGGGGIGNGMEGDKVQWKDKLAGKWPKKGIEWGECHLWADKWRLITTDATYKMERSLSMKKAQNISGIRNILVHGTYTAIVAILQTDSFQIWFETRRSITELFIYQENVSEGGGGRGREEPSKMPFPGQLVVHCIFCKHLGNKLHPCRKEGRKGGRR